MSYPRVLPILKLKDEYSKILSVKERMSTARLLHSRRFQYGNSEVGGRPHGKCKISKTVNSKVYKCISDTLSGDQISLYKHHMSLCGRIP